MKAATKENSLHLITKAELASILKIYPNSIQGWRQAKGFNNCYEGDKINLAKACKWLFDNWKEAEDSQAEVSEAMADSPALERMRLAKAKRAEKELEILEGHLVDKSRYLTTLKTIMAIQRTSIQSLHFKIGADLGLSAKQVEQVASACRALLEQMREEYNLKSEEWVSFINGEEFEVEE